MIPRLLALPETTTTVYPILRSLKAIGSPAPEVQSFLKKVAKENKNPAIRGEAERVLAELAGG